MNLALGDLPRDKVRYHVCWGSWNGPHTNDVPLRDVLELILQVNAGTILFEIAGVDETVAKRAFARVAYKMPVRCRFVKRRHTL